MFLTGKGDIPANVRAMKGGAVDFLTKPVEASELLAAIDRALDRSQVGRHERASSTVCARVSRRSRPGKKRQWP